MARPARALGGVRAVDGRDPMPTGFLARDSAVPVAYVALRTPPMPYRVLKLAENDALSDISDYGTDSGVNGGGNMYRRGGAKMYHGLGGSLSA